MGLNKEELYNGVKLLEGRIRKYEGKTLRKNHCSIRKNTIRNNHFIQELTPRIPPGMTNSPKNLLLKFKIIIWLCVLFFSDKLLTFINCCKTHHQPNSFTHSLTNLLYWAYWAHILFSLGMGYDLWAYNWRRLWGELALVKFTTVMASSGPQQTSPPHAELVNVNQQGELHNLE